MTTTEVIGRTRSAQEVLLWSRSSVDAALRAAVDTLPASMRAIAGYHFGWWDAQGAPDSGDGGKAVRPALVLLTATAVGGATADAVPAAVAVELVHNFSLLHDDIMDGDITRRHRPTAWTVYGRNAAILAGDALLSLAFDVLAASGHPAALEGVRMLNTAVLDLLDGQSADLAFEERDDVGLSECLSMAQGKTAALLGAACALGALFGGGDPAQTEHLYGFGEHLGLAFQFADDLLGIWGDPAVTGKPAYSDLRNRKKSLPVVAALTCDDDAGRELSALYLGDRELTADEVVRAAELIDAAGAREWSRSRADELLAQALHHLRSVCPTARAEAELEALARLACRRDR